MRLTTYAVRRTVVERADVRTRIGQVTAPARWLTRRDRSVTTPAG